MQIIFVFNFIITCLLRFSINMRTVCSSQPIMQNSFYAAVNHMVDLSGNKCDISERSTGQAPGS